MNTIKTIIYITAIIVSLHTINANTTINNRYYIGQGLDKVKVGQELAIKITNSLWLKTDFESYLKSFNGTFFSPEKINFGLGIEYKQWGWIHYCMHDLDQSSDFKYPIRNKFYVQW
ncbi:hypothetical protein DID76_02950 [Candidatus Marinamargulisbacteria bacterium SCGC AG-414-C22]|nr:hypothetical protein DID76_02950 [Candidatus Marinamargulisbacteria bacterium SCGC AG-414-C22]